MDHRPERVTAFECQWMTTLSGQRWRATALREWRPRVHWTHRIVSGPVACTVLYIHTYIPNASWPPLAGRPARGPWIEVDPSVSRTPRDTQSQHG